MLTIYSLWVLLLACVSALGSLRCSSASSGTDLVESLAKPKRDGLYSFFLSTCFARLECEEDGREVDEIEEARRELLSKELPSGNLTLGSRLRREATEAVEAREQSDFWDLVSLFESGFSVVLDRRMTSFD